ncbi:MAG: hypothetical protein KKD76_02135 [Verrucomicrobia bacterium]|nr:hypothetical protein [Verrucomicrobiota bacterium]
MKKFIGKKEVLILSKMMMVFLFLIAGITAASGEKENKIFLLKGLGNQIFLPESYLKNSNLTVEVTYLANGMNGFVLDKPFPSSLEALKGIKIIVLANVPASALGGFMGRRTLRRFVENGGSLLVFGGPFSYGAGDLVGTPLEDILPVAITGPWDVVKTTTLLVKPAKISSLTTDLNWSRKPVLYYCHKTTPKIDSDVLLECDGIPVLVTGKFGKGKVAAFMGTNLGLAKEGETFFYEWPDYETLLSRVMQWLLDGPGDIAVKK